jgi:secernin
MSRSRKAAITLISIALMLGAPEIRACDTWVAMGDVTEGRRVMLGKNSDRTPFGCQPLVLNGRTEWSEGSEIDLGRVRVPQVPVTFATLGSSPYWCWGYEEGMNEFGVAIGNEGVWTRPLMESVEAYARREAPAEGPTGMDLLRLGLERGRTALEALEVMTALLEEYGQFGSGVPGADAMGSYDNTYIIADPREAYILETAGRRWAARRIEEGSASISNMLSIGTEFDLASPDLAEYAASRGWWDQAGGTPFDFRHAYAARGPGLDEREKRASVRQEASCSLLATAEGRISLDSMMAVARDQSSEPSIDMDQTASSCVAVLAPADEGFPVFWWCAARPSNGCFIPCFVHGERLPEIVTRAGTFGKRVVAPSRASPDEFSPDSYWWLFRDLTDMVNADRPARQAEVRAEFDALEAAFAAGLAAVLDEAWSLRQAGDAAGAARVLDAYTASCTDAALAKADELRERYRGQAVEIPSRFRPYVGTYMGNFGPFENAEFEVKVQNERLAVDVPGQMVFELLEPDAEGRRYFALSPLVAVSFKDDGLGGVIGLIFDQASELARDAAADTAFASEKEASPEEHRPFVGRYIVPPGPAEVRIVSRDGTLMLEIPSRGEKIDLLPPDANGRWYFAADPAAAISFVEDESGGVTRLRLHQRFDLPRKTD